MKNIKDLLTRQLKNTEKQKVSLKPAPVPDKQVQDLYNYYKNAPASDINITGYILKLSLANGTVFPKQETIRNNSGFIAIKTVNRRTTILSDQDIIKKNNRGYNTCTYLVNPAFYHPTARRVLAPFFPILRSLTLLLLLSISEMPVLKGNVLPSLRRSYISFSQSNTVIERLAFYHRVRIKLQKNNKREVIMSSVSSLNRNICANLRFTDYASLLLSPFHEDVLQLAYDQFKQYKKTIRHPFVWLFTRAKNICESKQIAPDYEQMFREVKAAGYEPGSNLLLYSDEESQFRYNDPPTLKLRTYARAPARRRRTGPQVQREHAKQPKPISASNSFLARYGIPEWAKDNDPPTHRGQAKERNVHAR